jgi:hypothetical protein
MTDLAHGKRLLNHGASEGLWMNVAVVQDSGSANSAASDNGGLRQDEVIEITFDPPANQG